MSGFDAVAAFEPLARFVKREGTLGGAVPLRVAQACVPLLEGNALGHQIVFGKRLVVRARLGRRRLEATPELEEVDRVHHAAIGYLAAQGFLRKGGAWHTQLAKKWWWVERGVLRVWTGLLVRPRPGTWLRVSGAGSRAILGLGVRTAWIASDDEELVPLVLDFDEVADGTRLEGEVATIAAVVPAVAATIVTVDEAPELVKAHASFYDAPYFATKKGDITKKYRRTIATARGKGDEQGAPAMLRVAHVAGPRPEIVAIDRVLGPASTQLVPAPKGQALAVVRFVNAVPFTAHYDGNTMAVEPDLRALAAGARSIEDALGAPFASANKGSVLYLTKYFTPHPHGEPHFFVKPWAFTETSAGWSSIVEGVRGPGWDVMRGVVWTDRFHATPAVFSLQPGRRVRIAAGAPLIEVVPFPRSLASEGFTLHEEG